MPYDPAQLTAVHGAAQAILDAGDDPAVLDPALKDMESAMEAMQGASEDDMSMAGLGDKTPEEKVSLKAKLAKAAFGG